MTAPPPIPTTFPCLVRALYSWSGEEKTDLGFVEGDLIDCLSEGDGQWWFGKLKRNKVKGYFPSNFVELVNPPPQELVPEPILAPKRKAPSLRSASPIENQYYSYKSSYDNGGYSDPASFHGVYDPSTGIYHNLDYDNSYDIPNNEEVEPPPQPPPHKVAYRSKSALGIRPEDSPEEHKYETLEDGKGSRNLTPLRFALDDVAATLQSLKIEQRPTRRLTIRPTSQIVLRDDYHNSDTVSAQNDISSMQESSLHRRGSSLSKHALNRPKSSLGFIRPEPEDLSNRSHQIFADHHLQSTKSLLKMKSLMRSNTLTSNSTQATQSETSHASSGTDMTDMSATSAGSLARRRALTRTSGQEITAPMDYSTGEELSRTATSSSHKSLSSKASLSSLSLKKSGVFKKIKSIGSGISSSSRSQTSSSSSQSAGSYSKSSVTSYSSADFSTPAVVKPPAAQSELWIQAQTGMYRAKSLSKHEREDRRRKQALEGLTTLNPLDELYKYLEGDEGIDHRPVENGMDISKLNFATLDKTVRAISIPSLSTISSFTLTVLCRPYKSEIQRLRAIFQFCAEQIIWRHQPVDYLDDFTSSGPMDSARIFRSKQASAEEMAYLVMSMCDVLQIPCEVVRGYLRPPGMSEATGDDMRVNHAWNAVVIDNEWRMVDASLASPSHPRRSLYTNCSSTNAEDFYFLTEPNQMLFTHIPQFRSQQHVVPSVRPELLMELPSVCPTMFKYHLVLNDFDQSLLRVTGSEIVQIDVQTSLDVDLVSEVEVRGYCVDTDGDLMESGEVEKRRALTQPYWVHGQRFCRIKASLPAEERSGILKIYAGQRGLLQSANDNPYGLALAVPISYRDSGSRIVNSNRTSFDFVKLHPTPQALRFDLYVVQPQCRIVQCGTTVIFEMRQFPNNVETPGFSPSKQARLAVRSPSGKICRLAVKDGEFGGAGTAAVAWEGLVPCNEVGTWSGLTMADRGSSWVVFAEWTCAR
ncbi:uncharacterized protein V1516DRAFT_647436 [Lipomyces oligophaga]|uniref:uncharacterized protein n=1 Tax=Lipomyces oligophaga TaxID=45792 RepID=UPI0034CD3015